MVRYAYYNMHYVVDRHANAWMYMYFGWTEDMYELSSYHII